MEKFEIRCICGTCRNCQGGRCYYDKQHHPMVEHLDSCEDWGKDPKKKGGK